MFEFGQKTDIGIKRREEGNQDSILVCPSEFLGFRPPLLIVADGMGGYFGGSIASQLVIHTMQDYYKASNDNGDYEDLLIGSIHASHQAIKDRAASDPNLSKMGSTVAAAILLDGQVILANVGDSRGYLFSGGELMQVSYDHSLVAEQVRSGFLKAEHAHTHPQRNILTQSLSAQRSEVQVFSIRFKFEPGATLLLCSDGLWGPVDDRSIGKVLAQYPPQQAADRLVQMANERSGPDNISIVIAKRIK